MSLPVNLGKLKSSRERAEAVAAAAQTNGGANDIGAELAEAETEDFRRGEQK
jgi:hypothetical protein